MKASGIDSSIATNKSPTKAFSCIQGTQKYFFFPFCLPSLSFVICQGLLDFAFDPFFDGDDGVPGNGLFYVSYTVDIDDVGRKINGGRDNRLCADVIL